MPGALRIFLVVAAIDKAGAHLIGCKSDFGVRGQKPARAGA